MSKANDSSTVSPDSRLVKAYKPTELLEGVSPEDIKALPKVKALLQNIIEKEREKAYQDGYKNGLEIAKKEAYESAKAEYESEFEKLLANNEQEIVDVIEELKKPVPMLHDEVKESLKATFSNVLRAIVTDVSVYDKRMSEVISEMLISLPENNNLIRIYISNQMPDAFKNHFQKFDVEVESVEMDDLIRLETTKSKLRFSASEYAESILRHK